MRCFCSGFGAFQFSFTTSFCLHLGLSSHKSTPVMGNACGCFGSHENTDAIKSIMLDIQKQHASQDIHELIQLIDYALSQIKAPGEAAGPSTHLASLASATTSASQIIDFISTEADKMSNSELFKELEGTAVNVVKAIGETHWIFLGLSLVASSLQRYLTMKSNASECMDLLEKLVDLAKEVKGFKEAVTGEMERVQKSVQVIVEGVSICCCYISKGRASRYFTVNTMECQLQKTDQNIRDLRDSLISAGVIHIAKQITKRYDLSPSELLDFKPEGIDDQIRQVKEKLDMDGSEPAVAVVLWGHGGIGKSTLAASVIQDLYSKPTDFNFSRVIIDQNTPDKISHIVKLQRNIIISLGGGKWDFPDTAAGRQRLREVMANKYCFLYIDNVVDNDIKELLPPFETSDPQNSDPLREKQKSKLRIIITSRENNQKALLNIRIIEDYHVKVLSVEVARILLAKTILHGEVELHEKSAEMALITSVAQACQGVPILLSVFGNHLKVERKEFGYKDVFPAYTDVLQALQEGKLDKYNSGDEELLSKKLFFVYDKMRDEEAKEAFLDICTYFHGCQWDQVAHIVDEYCLHALQKRKLVNISESDTVTVHDVLRSMGVEKAKYTRLTKFEEFLKVKDDTSRLRNIKGLALLSTTSLTSLDCKHLNAMHNSLRVLQLGHWVRLDGPPCVDAFEELRYLQIGDLKDFPFKDVSTLKKLAVFQNSSKPGMELDQLPPNLKHVSHQMPYRDCNAFTKIPLRNLKSLERFRVGSKRSVCLPQGFELPASIVNLELIGCKNLPKRFDKLTALESLILDKCDMKCLAEGFEKLNKLKHLSMEHCTNLIFLPDRLGSSDALTYLSLRGCTGLEKLPAGLEILHRLQNLNISECQNLSALPDAFNELSALEMLDLRGCISLQKLPDSFGRLQLQTLNLYSLTSLQGLPESFGDLRCLTKLTMNNCSSLVNLPMGFGKLSSLEELYLLFLPLSSLPDGFGKLKNLKILQVDRCYKLERVSGDFQNLVSLKFLYFTRCIMLEGAAMDKIVNLQKLRFVYIKKSIKLMERWNELKKENEEHAMYVKTLKTSLADDEVHRTSRVNLFRGQCIQLDSTRQQLIEHSSMSVSNNTIFLVMTGELHGNQLKPVAQAAIERAFERAERDCSGRLLIIHVCTRTESHGQTPSKQEEMESIRQILMLLPPGVSYAIPSTDTRRLSLISGSLFGVYDIFLHRPDQQPFAYFMGDVKADDQDRQILIYCIEKMPEIKSSDKESIREGESSNEENEVPEKIEEFINFISEARTQKGDPSLPKELMMGKFIEALKNNDIHHLVNRCQQTIGMDQLEGKHLAVNMIDLNSPECTKLQDIYCSIQDKDSKFEVIWISLSQDEDFGFGTYSRTIEHMSGMFLPDPKLIKLQDIKNKSPRIIIFNQEGYVVNVNALPLIISWGAEAYPFTENVVSQIVSNIRTKSSLDVLFYGMNFSIHERIEETEMINSKCVFLYAEPPCAKFRMNSMLEQFAQTQENITILYLGSLFSQKNDAESVNELYEKTTQNMQWPKLSFWDMMKFWYRCKCLSTYIDKMEDKVDQCLTSLKRILNHLLVDGVEGRWLILVDRDGIVTANAKDVVELMCASVNEKEDHVDTRIKRELREGLQNGRCNHVARTFYKDEISAYPHHEHPLMLTFDKEERRFRFSCDRCHVFKQWAPHEKRAYRCNACDWDFCGDCWEVIAKEQIKEIMENNN